MILGFHLIKNNEFLFPQHPIELANKFLNVLVC